MSIARDVWQRVKRRLTVRLGATLALWQIEGKVSTPLAFLTIAALGRWPAALVMGVLAAGVSSLFVFLIEGEKTVQETIQWARRRWVVRRLILPWVEWRERAGPRRIIGLLALVTLVLLAGPLDRALGLHFFGYRGRFSYLIAALGAFPHSLLWVGLVVGGIWENLLWPLAERL